jgi:ABC-type sulfate transport system permease subunit
LHAEYHFQAAFAAASLLALVGLLGLVARRIVGARIGRAH